MTQIGEFLVSDRAYVFEIKDELMNNTHEWTAPGISPQLEKLLGDTHGFAVSGYDLLFRGVCPECGGKTSI